ncbi:MAG TPA: transcriptional regulator ArgR [Candidatus Paenibacillus intestinavium]|nr:transcriptional regulator ArgR [Candidatus Paenibacillus intestinavium]
MKGIRQFRIKEIITGRDVETQEELVEALRQSGMQVTQATVSRDIKELMLIKILSSSGSYKYAMPGESQKPNPIHKLRRALQDHFTHIDFADNLVVMKCLPGTANTIAALIDALDSSDIMGTISGDDTILIICRSSTQSQIVVERFIEMLK